jgi:hypothetical protein
MLRLISLMCKNWKLGIHLLFRTYHFGVNNEWWVKYRSIFGLPFYKRLNIIKHYKEMRFRAEIGFVSKETFKRLFPMYARRR